MTFIKIHFPSKPHAKNEKWEYIVFYLFIFVDTVTDYFRVSYELRG